MARAFEWSGMAMYSFPRSRAAAAISSRLALEAVHPDARAGLVFAVRQHLLDAREGEELVEGRHGVGAGHEEVEIADGFAPAAEAAGGRNCFHSRDLPERFDDFGGHSFGIAQEVAAGPAAVFGD